MKFGVGQPVPRKEDPRLVTGGGQFTDDVNLPSQVYAAFFRSPHAHGRIVDLDVSNVRTAPGVVAVYTAEDLRELGAMPCRAQLTDRAGNPHTTPSITCRGSSVFRRPGGGCGGSGDETTSSGRR